MSTLAAGFTPIPWMDALRLGRVSNLPTVWANVLAATALVGASLTPAHALILVAMSFMYVGGMYLNDAFDAEIDARERPERPIPSGRVSRRTVFAAGYGMLGLAVIALATFDWRAGVLGVALAAAVVAYNVHHKGFAFSPVVMGATRMLVYAATAAALTAAWPAQGVWIASATLLAWIIGLTYVAKQENLGHVKHVWPLAFLAAPLVYGVWASGGAWPALIAVAVLAAWAGYALRFLVRRGPGDVPRAVISLIAGVALLDAVVAASAGAPLLALACAACFALTLIFQRVVPGT